MIQPVLPLILASGSPRRRELLDLMGLTYTVETPDVDESFSGRPSETVMEISRRKAAAVAARHSDSIIIAADTLVFADGALGKPHTPERAKEMLRSLAGNWHHVYTGITVINTRSGRILRNVDKTRVHLVSMTEQEIDAYVVTGEPLDKAGAYGIQGMGGMFVDRIDGSYSNVVGLPMSMLRIMLAQVGGVDERGVI
ncbi:MAG: septum formation inhibitor Maf [Clostridiales bacterium]|nr:septum formation inhibitor Maf [Clostridiales bacterium]